MIPLRDLNPRRSFPIVTIGLIAINVLAFLYQISLGSGVERFIMQMAFIPGEFFAPGDTAADVRSIFVSMFLHGGFMHLAGNMLYLWIFGDNVEDRMGHFLYLVFYLLSGVAATFAHAFSAPHSNIPAIGASGAISGVLGAYLVLFPGARVLTLIPYGFYMRTAELPAIVVLGLWFVLQFLSGLVGNAAGAGVAFWAHIGGFVFGMAFAVLFYGRRSAQPRTEWSA
jgi:membrane associated rhomboid family serine protease